MKKARLKNILFVLTSIFLVVGLLTFAHGCGYMHGVHGPCYKTKVIAIISAAVLVLISVIDYFVRSSKVKNFLSVLQLLTSIFLIVLPTYVAPVCRMKTMHCNIYTKPFIMLIGSIDLAISVVAIVVGVLVNKRKENEAYQ